MSGENMEFAGSGSDGKPDNQDDECHPQGERRAMDRFVCSRPNAVQVMVRPTLHSYPAHVHNFTRAGLGLSAHHPFEVGTVLAIQLRSASTGLSCVLSATVLRCQRKSEDMWFVGCKLSRYLSDEEARALF
jgi:hypothetical protein